jgi:hypothetical protein
VFVRNVNIGGWTSVKDKPGGVYAGKRIDFFSVLVCLSDNVAAQYD